MGHWGKFPWNMRSPGRGPSRWKSGLYLGWNEESSFIKSWVDCDSMEYEDWRADECGEAPLS